MNAVYSLLFIIAVPSVILMGQVMIPLHPPVNGVQHNWGWVISVFMGTIASSVTNWFWLTIYLRKTYWETKFFPVCTSMSSIANACVHIVITQYRARFKGIGFLFVGVVTATFPLSMALSLKLFKIQQTNEFKEIIKSFNALCFGYSIIVALSWTYVILFYAVERLQLLWALLYGSLIFGFKYGMLLHTRRHTHPKYHGLSSFWIEFFHCLFSTMCFGAIHQTYTAIVVILLKLDSTAFALFNLTPYGRKFNIFIDRKLLHNRLHPGALKRRSSSLPFLSEASSPTLSTCDTPPMPLQPFSVELSAAEHLSSSSNHLHVTPLHLDTDPSIVFVPTSRMLAHPASSPHSHKNLEYADLVVRTCLLSILANIMSSIVYLPLAFFLRFGWNRDFYPFVAFSDEAFRNALIYNASSCTASLVAAGVLYAAIHSPWLRSTLHTAPSHHNQSAMLDGQASANKRQPVFWDSIAPLLVADKLFFVGAIMNGISVAASTILYQNFIYYAFVSRNLT